MAARRKATAKAQAADEAATALRQAALRDGLVEAAQLLKSRHAGAICEKSIEDYVSLHWLEWRGGGLFLTITGENICRQARAKPR